MNTKEMIKLLIDVEVDTEDLTPSPQRTGPVVERLTR